MKSVIDLFHYSFLVNALVTGSAVALAAAVVGYFMICRRSTFAGHALPNIGFSGAAAAVLLGIEPVYGLCAVTISAAVAMGLMGRDLRERDVTVGVIITFALGLGFLFLALYAGYARRIYGILFGSIVGISAEATRVAVSASAGALCILGVVFRPLLYSTFDPELAAARGVPVTFLSVLFLVVLALVVSVAVQVMGALLLFTLMVGPAAAATRLVRHPPRAIALSAGLGLLYVWVGILLAARLGNVPVSFCIAAISFLVYLPARLLLRSPRSLDRRAGAAAGSSL